MKEFAAELTCTGKLRSLPKSTLRAAKVPTRYALSKGKLRAAESEEKPDTHIEYIFESLHVFYEFVPYTVFSLWTPYFPAGARSAPAQHTVAASAAGLFWGLLGRFAFQPTRLNADYEYDRSLSESSC